MALTGGDLSRLSIPLIVTAAAQETRSPCPSLTVGRNLGIGIASLINSFNPDLVALGHPESGGRMAAAHRAR